MKQLKVTSNKIKNQMNTLNVEIDQLSQLEVTAYNSRDAVVKALKESRVKLSDLEGATQEKTILCDCLENSLLEPLHARLDSVNGKATFYTLSATEILSLANETEIF